MFSIKKSLVVLAMWAGRIQLEDVVPSKYICALDPVDPMLPLNVLINLSIDSFADANENSLTLLAVTAHHTQDHLLCRIFGEGRDVDAGIHIGHRGVRQVAAVTAVDSHVPR
jgi:hypothetical protein